MVDVRAFAPARISDRIADHFRQEIVRGRLREGDRLPPEAECVASFRVSRAVLREAFRVLEAEDLIAVQRGARGAVVRAPSPDVAARYVGLVLQSARTRLNELFEGRIMIQPTAVRLLASHRPEEAIHRLEETIEAEAGSLLVRVEFVEHSLRFQRLLTEDCGQPVVAVFGAILEGLSRDFLRAAMTVAAYPDHAHAWLHGKHKRLVELIRDAEPTEAESFWRQALTEQMARALSTFGDVSYDAWVPGIGAAT